jgi:hypothetical protein
MGESMQLLEPQHEVDVKQNNQVVLHQKVKQNNQVVLLQKRCVLAASPLW